jgi:hypothetical protein
VKLFARARHDSADHRSLLDSSAAGQHLVEPLVNLKAIELGQEAEPAEVNAEDQCLAAHDGAHRAQDAAIAAETDQEVTTAERCRRFGIIGNPGLAAPPDDLVAEVQG